jgi:hypothetical protein
MKNAAETRKGDGKHATGARVRLPRNRQSLPKLPCSMGFGVLRLVAAFFFKPPSASTLCKPTGSDAPLSTVFEIQSGDESPHSTCLPADNRNPMFGQPREQLLDMRLSQCFDGAKHIDRRHVGAAKGAIVLDLFHAGAGCRDYLSKTR